MFGVLSTENIAPDVHRLVIEAPRVAAARQAGQFVIVRAAEGAERIPLTIADADAEAGTIMVYVQAIGPGTREIVAMAAKGGLANVAGPLGRPTEIRKWGKVICVGGGVGTAVLYPQARALAEAGNDVTAIIGARSSDLVILRDELAEFCKSVVVATEDGSEGIKGMVSDALAPKLVDEHARPDAVYAVGPVAMMSAVAEMTRPHNIKTIVSLNPIMVDGTGMCGGCRVTVGREVKFACVDGPEFDGHQVDFAELSSRQRAYDEVRCKLDELAEKSRQDDEGR